MSARLPGAARSILPGAAEAVAAVSDRGCTGLHRLRTRGVRLAVLVAVLSGCAMGDSGGRSGDVETGPSGLEGRTFTSTDVRGHDLVEGTKVTLSFDENHISARAGCNTMFGAARWDDGTLRIGGDSLASTMMACAPDLQAQDQWLTRLLTSSPRIEYDGGSLRIGDATSGVTLTATAEARTY